MLVLNTYKNGVRFAWAYRNYLYVDVKNTLLMCCM